MDKKDTLNSLIKITVIIFIFSFFPEAVFASAKAPLPPDIKAAILVDLKTGKVLYQQDADKVIQPASLSKIMSLYLIAEDIAKQKASYTDLVTVSDAAVQTGGSKMLFEPGVQCDVFDLVAGMAVHSANDAAVALAEHFDGSVEEFVKRMNSKAKMLGLNQTHFVNPNGLPDKKQKTTARDICRLSRDYIRRFPDARKIHSLESYTFNGLILNNRNDLLQNYPGADGLKTGYVSAAGFHMVATASRGNVRLMAVVLGAKNKKIRSERTRKLLDYGFGRINHKNQKNRIGG